MDQIRKPLSLVKNDFVNDIVQIINNADLPIFVVEYALRDVLNEVHSLSVQRSEAEKLQYENALKQHENDSHSDHVVEDPSTT